MPRRGYASPRWALGLLWWALGGCATTMTTLDTESREALRSADLLFLDLDCEACDAIARVTQQQLGVSGPSLSHVGMVAEHAGHLVVLEAWPEPTPGAVRRTELATFVGRVKGGAEKTRGYYRLRLPERHQGVAQRALGQLEQLLGQPYDDAFLPDNGRFYCSELIYEAFRRAQRGVPLFTLLPMTFGATGSPERAVWERYYATLGLPVPEGKPGLSPLGIYLAARRLGARPPGAAATSAGATSP